MDARNNCNFFYGFERRHPEPSSGSIPSLQNQMRSLFDPPWIEYRYPNEHAHLEGHGAEVCVEALDTEEPVLVPNAKTKRRRRRKRKKKKQQQHAVPEQAQGENNEEEAAPVAGESVGLPWRSSSGRHNVLGPVLEDEEEIQDLFTFTFSNMDPEELEDELNDRVEEIMETPLVLAVLEAGLDVEEVKEALKDRLYEQGGPFESRDDLFMYILDREDDESEGYSESEDYEEPGNRVPSQSTPARDVGTSTGVRSGGIMSTLPRRNDSLPLPRHLPQRNIASAPPTTSVPCLSTFRIPSGSLASQIPLQRRPIAWSCTIRSGGAIGVQRPGNNPPATPRSCFLSRTSQAQHPKGNTAKENADSKLCSVCFEEEVKTVFMPCKHIACCERCAGILNHCPICRCAITEKINVYFA